MELRGTEMPTSLVLHPKVSLRDDCDGGLEYRVNIKTVYQR